MSASVLSLPATMNATTLDYLLRETHDLYYPSATAEFTVRIAVLLTIVASAQTGVRALISHFETSTILLAFFYLSHHLLTTFRSPGSLWFIRLVERPSGRFIVLNPRITWSLAIISHGSFVLILVVLFWGIYAREWSKRTYIALKTLQPLPQFLGGWVGTWASLQAFLVASESANSALVPAWLANTIFLAGGFVLALPDLVLAIVNSHLALRMDDRYEDLVQALRSLDAQLAGRTPSLAQLAGLKQPAEALLKAAEKLKHFSIAQYCVTIMLPIACLVVNAGGLALARKIHVHIRENVSLIALHTATTSEVPHPSQQVEVSLALVPTRTGTTSDSPPVLLKSLSRGAFGEAEAEKVGTRERDLCSVERGVGSVAAVGAAGGGTSDWVTAQSRKVEELKKAKRDLILVTTTIVFICVLLIGDVVWLMVGVVKGGLRRGGWKHTELSAALDKWILFTVMFCACVYLNYNALALNRIPRVLGDSRHSKRDPTAEVLSLPVLSSTNTKKGRTSPLPPPRPTNPPNLTNLLPLPVLFYVSALKSPPHASGHPGQLVRSTRF
ncbi:hypothetical protein JCM10295v2_000043 [Rhodotorula toruloides]